MAKQANRAGKTATPAGDETSRPELAALLPLVRLLARGAAREAWAASQTKDQTHHDEQDHPHVHP